MSCLHIYGLRDQGALENVGMEFRHDLKSSEEMVRTREGIGASSNSRLSSQYFIP